jgi:hypothetical protein
MISALFGDQLIIAKNKSSNWDETLSNRSVSSLSVAQIASLSMSTVIIHTGMIKAICQRLSPFTSEVLTAINGGQDVSECEPRALPPAKPIQPLRFEDMGDNDAKPEKSKPW